MATDEASVMPGIRLERTKRPLCSQRWPGSSSSPATRKRMLRDTVTRLREMKGSSS